MSTVRSPLVLRVVAVVFAVSLLASYVVFSQTRAKPRPARDTKSQRVLGHVQMASESTGGQDSGDSEIVYGTKSAPVFDLGDMIQVEKSGVPESETSETIFYSTKSAPVFPARTEWKPEWLEFRLNDPPAQPKPTPLDKPLDSTAHRPPGWNQVSPGSKVLVPVVSPSAFDQLINQTPAESK